MRRADRLFQIVQILRNRRSVTAKILAERLEVSERTIYRDIQDLSLSGVPVEGEAGVGYMLRYSLDIPPLMFDRDEIQALVLGARMVSAWASRELESAARRAIDKVEAVIPENLKHLTGESHLYAFPYNFAQHTIEHLDSLRQAINDRNIIEFHYQRLNGTHSQRRANPLGLYFWGQAWTLATWCHLREDFRSFRVDRMTEVRRTMDNYPDAPGYRLEDYVVLRAHETDKEEESSCPGVSDNNF